MTAEETAKDFFNHLPLSTTFKQANEAIYKAITAAIAEERERCANVAETYRYGTGETCNEIAAAIRKEVKP